MSKPTIEDMKRDVEDLRSHKEHENPHYAALAMAGEVGELCNFLKKELRSGGTVDNSTAIAKEVPDILFYLLQLCEDRGIDIQLEWDGKMKHNAQKYGKSLSRFSN